VIKLAEISPTVHVGDLFDIAGIDQEFSYVLPQQSLKAQLGTYPSHIEAFVLLLSFPYERSTVALVNVPKRRG